MPSREQHSSVIAGSPSPLPPVSDLARVLCLQKARFSPNHPFLPLVSDHNLSCAHYRNIWINSYLTASYLHCLVGFTQNNSTILSNMMRTPESFSNYTSKKERIYPDGGSDQTSLGGRRRHLKFDHLCTFSLGSLMARLRKVVVFAMPNHFIDIDINILLNLLIDINIFSSKVSFRYRYLYF